MSMIGSDISSDDDEGVLLNLSARVLVMRNRVLHRKQGPQL
jgi:hypothetical protein